MNAISILSPHFDDAVFSLCLSISRWAERNIAVHVINFYTCSAYAPRFASNDPAKISDIRMREDRRALSKISPGIRITNIGLADAPVRLNIPWQTVCNPENQVLVADTQEALLNTQIRFPNGWVIAPLALGNHVDHKIVHRWATQHCHSKSLAFYEDLPYATWMSEHCIRERVNCAEQRMRRKLKPVTISGSTRGPIAYKRRVASEYRSQITKEDGALMAEFSKRYGGRERLWIPSHHRGWNTLTR